MWAALAHERPYAEQVDVDDATERLVIAPLAGQTAQVADSGVVDQDVDSTMLLDGLGDHPANIVFVGDIACMTRDRSAVTLAQTLGVLFEKLGASGSDCDVGPVLGEYIGKREAEAHRATRDQGNFAREIEH